MNGEPRYERKTSGTWEWMCLDCGCFVADKKAHTRFHSILSSHAWSLAVLKTSHIADHLHAKYDVVERIDSKKFDNWSADALAEVMAEMDAGKGQVTPSGLRSHRQCAP